MTTSAETNPSFDPTPPEAWGPLSRWVRQAVALLERARHLDAASGALLLLAAAVALAWASSPWGASYEALFRTPVGVRVGALSFDRDLAFVINDGLMAIFFFVVGLEIRREIHDGALSEWRRAVLPVAAALGGMLVPALVYLAVAGSGEARSGWGVPMATDIAFALAIMSLLGRRVPAALRVLLLALAVIDDLGAIVVIALFYSSGVEASSLLVAAGSLAAISIMQRAGVRSKLAYFFPACAAWGATYSAGIHPTIAGVAIGLITPVRVWLGRETTSPAESLTHSLHPWVSFGIMPLFAFANAGVPVSAAPADGASLRVVAAVMAGLVIGKPVGVMLATWLSCRARLAALPEGLTFRHVALLSVVAGIGFTMSLFIAPLAFADDRLLAAAKLGVLAASGIAAVAALVLGRGALAPALGSAPARSG